MGSANSKLKAIESYYENNYVWEEYEKETGIEALIFGYLRCNDINLAKDVVNHLHSVILSYYKDTLHLKSVLISNGNTSSRVIRYSQPKGKWKFNPLIGHEINVNENKTHTAMFRILSKHKEVLLRVSAVVNDARYHYGSNGDLDVEFRNGDTKEYAASPYGAEDFISVRYVFYGSGKGGCVMFKNNDEGWMLLTEKISPNTKNAYIAVSSYNGSKRIRGSSVTLVDYSIASNEENDE